VLRVCGDGALCYDAGYDGILQEVERNASLGFFIKAGHGDSDGISAGMEWGNKIGAVAGGFVVDYLCIRYRAPRRVGDGSADSSGIHLRLGNPRMAAANALVLNMRGSSPYRLSGYTQPISNG